MVKMLGKLYAFIWKEEQGRITVKDIGWAITKRAKHAKSRGVWGHAPPGNF